MGGCGSRGVAEERLWGWNILIVVWLHTSTHVLKLHRHTHTHTHIPTNACTTSELRIGSVDCIKVMFLVLILY